jgi:hypothetical protein
MGKEPKPAFAGVSAATPDVGEAEYMEYIAV